MTIVLALVYIRLSRQGGYPSLNEFGLILVASLYFLPNILFGTLLPVDGTLNHDYLWYAINSKYFLEFSLSDPLTVDALIGVDYSAPRNIAIITRFGTEAIIAAVAATLFIDPVIAMLIIQITSVWVTLHYALRVVDARITIFTAPALLMPTLAFTVYNGNTATLVGIAVLSAFFLLAKNFYEERSSLRSSIIGMALSISCIAYVYTEFLFIMAVVIMMNSVLRPNISMQLIQREWKWIVGAFICVALITLPISLSLLEAISLRLGASQEGGPDYYDEDMKWSLALPFIFFHSFGLTTLKVWVATLSIIYLTVLFLRDQLQFRLAILIATLLPFAFSWVQNYDYGLQKAVQFFSPISILIVVSAAVRLERAFKDLRTRNLRWRKTQLISLFAVVMVFLYFSLGKFFVQNLNFYRTGQDKRVTAQMMQLAVVEQLLPAGAVITFSDQFSNRFHETVWISYILDDVRVRLPEGLQGLGYLRRQPQLDQDTMTYEISRWTVRNRRLEENQMPFDFLFSNNDYFVALKDPSQQFWLKGFYNRENWGRWMPERASIDVLPVDCARELSFQIVNVLGDPGGLSIGSETVVPSELPYNVAVIIPPGISEMNLITTGQGTRPVDIGLNEDTRYLTWGIDDMELGSCVANSETRE